jgi:hypothetical protein
MQRAIPKPNVQINKPLPVGGGQPDLANRVTAFVQQEQQQGQ